MQKDIQKVNNQEHLEILEAKKGTLKFTYEFLFIDPIIVWLFLTSPSI